MNETKTATIIIKLFRMKIVSLNIEQLLYSALTYIKTRSFVLVYCLPLTALLIQSCFQNITAQGSATTTTIKQKSISKTGQQKEKVVEIGYYDRYETLPKFHLDTASEEDFLLQPSRSTFKKEKLHMEKGFFSIPIENRQTRFKAYDENNGEDGLNGNEYLGYDNSLKLYAIQQNSVSESLGFAEMNLIHSGTGYHYRIISLGDWSVSLPVPSINNIYMVYWQNPEYESKTLSIAVLKINTKAPYRNLLKEYTSCFTDNGLSIEEIRWKDNNHFFIKAYTSSLDGQGDEFRTYSYFNAKINNK